MLEEVWLLEAMIQLKRQSKLQIKFEDAVDAG